MTDLKFIVPWLIYYTLSQHYNIFYNIYTMYELYILYNVNSVYTQWGLYTVYLC